jgi:pyruvate/2-oxoglutarate dehydrogenase complex dihydrolipoamide acyltransferase (E2) component
MLRLSKEMTTGEVVEWLKSSGELVEKGEPLLTVLTEKANVELEAPASGVLLKVLIKAGQEATVGAVLGWIGQPGEEPEISSTMVSSASPRVTTSHPLKTQNIASPSAELVQSGRVKASPVARRLAAQHRMPLEAVQGSRPDGLITQADVEKAIASAGTGPNVEPGDFERLPLAGLRKAMFESMTQSKRHAAEVTTVVDVDMGAVAEAKRSASFSYTTAVAKAAALALREHRILNSSVDGSEILLCKRVHVGVAVDTPRGLTVATVVDSDRKSLAQIDKELRQFSAQLKSGSPSARPEAAPTFTVTNSGVLGSLLFTPIINPPQSAILGMGKVQERPVVREGHIVARPVMYLCLTYDHRIIEGAEAVRFLQSVKSFLENPATLERIPGVEPSNESVKTEY